MTKPTYLKDPLEVYQGDHFVTRLVLVPKPGVILTEWSNWRAWISMDDRKVADFGVDSTLLAENRITLDLPESVTEVLGTENGDKLDWDIQAIRGGRVKTWLRGTIKWFTDVTKES